jgi:hypothetical protein
MDVVNGQRSQSMDGAESHLLLEQGHPLVAEVTFEGFRVRFPPSAHPAGALHVVLAVVLAGVGKGVDQLHDFPHSLLRPWI